MNKANQKQVKNTENFKQKNVLNNWLSSRKEEIGMSWEASDLPYDIFSQLEEIQDSEYLYSAITNHVEDIIFADESKASEYYGQNEPDKLLITIRCEKCYDVIRGEFDIDVKRKAHDHLIDEHEYTWLPTERKFKHDEQNRIYQNMISNMEYSKVNYSDNVWESKANEVNYDYNKIEGGSTIEYYGYDGRTGNADGSIKKDKAQLKGPAGWVVGGGNGTIVDERSFISSESKANEVNIERGDNSMKINGKNVIKIWESFSGWYWYAIEDQGSYTGVGMDGKNVQAHAWYGYVQGMENEWGTWDSNELERAGVWTVPKSNWGWTGKESKASEYGEKNQWYQEEFDLQDQDGKESWNQKSSINRIEALERVGIKQGDAIKLSGLEFEDFGEDLQGALKGDVDDDKEEYGEVDNPNSEFDQNYPDYNNIGKSQTGMTNYECEFCDNGFTSNEALSIHHNDKHAIAPESLDGYDYAEKPYWLKLQERTIIHKNFDPIWGSPIDEDGNVHDRANDDDLHEYGNPESSEGDTLKCSHCGQIFNPDNEQVLYSHLAGHGITESKASEDDPDFDNDADFEGKIDGVSVEPSQYTQSGMDHTDYGRGDIDTDSKASEVDIQEDYSGNVTIDGKPVKKMWSSRTGWIWYGLRNEGNGRWFGYVEGNFPEYGYFDENELNDLMKDGSVSVLESYSKASEFNGKCKRCGLVKDVQAEVSTLMYQDEYPDNKVPTPICEDCYYDVFGEPDGMDMYEQAYPSQSMIHDDIPYMQEEDQTVPYHESKASEKYGELTSKQKNVLNNWLSSRKEEIGMSWEASDLPYDIFSQLEEIQDSEYLYSAITNHVEDIIFADESKASEMSTSEWENKIEKLSSKKGVKKIAVQNFLGTVGSNPDYMSASMNAEMDAGMYGWNYATQGAIHEGISIFFNQVKSNENEDDENDAVKNLEIMRNIGAKLYSNFGHLSKEEREKKGLWFGDDIGMSDESKASEHNVGDYVTMTDDALDNYGQQYRGQSFRISHVAKSVDDHMGYDEGMGGENLYDLDGFNSSLYDYEVESTDELKQMWNESKASEARKLNARQKKLIEEWVGSMSSPPMVITSDDLPYSLLSELRDINDFDGFESAIMRYASDLGNKQAMQGSNPYMHSSNYGSFESKASEAGLEDHSCPECGFITSDNSDYVDHLKAHEE